MTLRTLRLGTRRSALAQAQAHWVAGRLRANFPDLHVELVLITTTGDLSSSSPTAPPSSSSPVVGGGSIMMDPPPTTAGDDALKGGLKALFTKEIEEALLDRRIDLAVHSLKDMPAELPPGLVIGAVPEREDARDVWISKNRIPFSKISPKARIGTGAVRRQAQLQRLLPKAEIIPIRGNVDTRLHKLFTAVTPAEAGVHQDMVDSRFRGNDEKVALDGIVLAAAGLKRLGKENFVTEILKMDVLLPAIGQGCLGIEVRELDRNLLPFLAALDHPASHLCAKAERSFLKTLGGTCQTPIAGHAEISGNQLCLVGLVIAPTGERQVRDQVTGPTVDAEALGETLGKRLLAAGADQILK